MAGMKRELPCRERRRQTKKTEGGRQTDGAEQCERAEENPVNLNSANEKCVRKTFLNP